MLKAVKALNISDVVLGQYEGDPDGTTSDSKLSYLDDPTVPKGKLHSHTLIEIINVLKYQTMS